MAKTSQIEKVISDLMAERDLLTNLLAEFEWEAKGRANIEGRIRMLAECLSRLPETLRMPSAPKPTRTRKSRKATEPGL